MSRYLVIALAFIAAAVKVAQGAWAEAIGLAALGGGLAALKLARSRPAMKYVAFAGFAVTAVALAALAVRYWGS